MKFLIAIHHADAYDPSTEDEAMGRAIDALNDEMVEAGIRVFVGGLHRASESKSIRLENGGQTTVSDGTYLPTNEHVGGLWVIEASSMEEAVEWGRKAAIACRVPVEVRQFH